jgi:flagellar biosynthesis/type III secretory pathway protein FliH
VYFQIIYNALREPMRRALEALIMERQTENKATFPPFAQQLIDRGKLEGLREGLRKGKLEGLREGKLEGRRDVLLRLLTRARIPLTEDDRARIQACSDVATLDRWVDNVIGAKTATDVLS